MWKIITIGVCLLGIVVWRGHEAAVHATSQRGVARQSTTDALQKLEKDSWEAWKARDAGFFSSFLSDDHLEIGAGGVADKTAVLKTVATPDVSRRAGHHL
jgi:hypothetical protein